MKAPETSKNVSRMRQHPWLVAAAVVLLVGGTAFAATGGFQSVGSWFVQFVIGGEVVEGEITAYEETENGANMTVDLGEHGQADLEIVKEGDGQTVTINAELTGGEGTDGDVQTIEITAGQTEEEAGSEAAAGDGE